MGLISVSNIPDGTPIDARDVNDPLNTIVNEINGNIENVNLKDSAVTEAKLAASAVTRDKVADGVINTAKLDPIMGVWTAWTPTFNFVNAASQACTATGAYTVIGKTCHFWVKMVVNASSNFAGLTAIILTLPFVSNNFTAGHFVPLGTIFFRDTPSGSYIFGNLVQIGTQSASIWTTLTNATYAGAADVTGAVPFGWGPNDYFIASGTYEVV